IPPPSSVPPSPASQGPLMSQAPVDSMVMGLMQGTQTSPAAHVAWGRSPAWGSLPILSMQRPRHTPSLPPIDWHGAGTKASPAMMISSGTQAPGSLVMVVHVAKPESKAGGTAAAGRQCATPPFLVQQGGPSVLGSRPLAAQVPPAPDPPPPVVVPPPP